jgi:hypothetical protein
MHSVVASNSCPFCLCSAQCAAPHAAGTCAQVFSCVRMLAKAWSSMHVRSTAYIMCTHNAQQRRTQFIANELMFSPVCGHTTASKWVDPHVSACASMARSITDVPACAQYCIHSVTHSMKGIVAPYSSPVSLCSTSCWPHGDSTRRACFLMCAHACTSVVTHARAQYYIHHEHTQCTAGSYPSHCQ